MLKEAILFEREQSISVLEKPEPEPRGDLQRRMSAQDLVEFGRCPYRWVWGEEPEEPWRVNGPTLTEWMAFDRTLMERYFIRRPDTYESLKLECPKCHSEGPAKVCTKCGQRRRNTVAPRPWSNASKTCKAWLAQAEASHRRPVPGPEWDRAHMGVEAILEDAAIQAVIRGSCHLRTMHGTWVDEATGLAIPVWSRATLMPSDITRTVSALVQLVETRNADPRYWEGIAYSTGLHIGAALRLALWNKLSEADVREHLWIVVERDAPRLVARRRACPELLDEGRTRLAELMATYARCLHEGHWPRFEAEGDTTLEAWAPVTIQPWMTNGAGPHGGYFAPTVLPLPEGKEARYEEAV